MIGRFDSCVSCDLTLTLLTQGYYPEIKRSRVAEMLKKHLYGNIVRVCPPMFAPSRYFFQRIFFLLSYIFFSLRAARKTALQAGAGYCPGVKGLHHVVWVCI